MGQTKITELIAKPAQPSISVVIITRNRPDILAGCLEHLARQRFCEFETVVVDSSSNEETQTLLRNWPDVHAFRILNARNNMPQARNLGIEKSRGEIIAFIDDDCMVQEEWLNNLVRGYDDLSVGGVGGRVIDPSYLDSEEDRIGLVLPEGALVRNFGIEGDEYREVEWLPGCNMSFQRSALAASGGFDTHFLGDNSFEDVDQCVRVRKAGCRLLFNPQAAVIHLAVGRSLDVVSRDHESPSRRYYTTRNATYFYLKYFGATFQLLKGWFWKPFLGLSKYSIKNPSFAAWKRWLATFVGYLAGFFTWIKYRSSL